VYSDLRVCTHLDSDDQQVGLAVTVYTVREAQGSNSDILIGYLEACVTFLSRYSEIVG
jgi:hypothetical protein